MAKRRGFLILLMGLLVAGWTSSPLRPLGKDDFVPWPWGAEVALPWVKLEGVWMTESRDDGFELYILRPISTPQGPVLVVDLVEAPNCRVRARGIAGAYGRVLRGHMISVDQSKPARPFEMRVFSRETVRTDLRLPMLDGNYFLLSLPSLEGAVVSHRPMLRLTSETPAICRSGGR